MTNAESAQQLTNTIALEDGFRRSRLSQKEHFAAKEESTPTEAEHGIPLPLIEVGVLETDKSKKNNLIYRTPFITSCV